MTVGLQEVRLTPRAFKMIEKARDERFLFLLANIIFSASTFVVTFILPYLLTREDYSHFVFAFQLALVLSTFLEFGISTSLLREYVTNRYRALRFALLAELFLLTAIGVLLLAPASYTELLLDTTRSAKAVLIAGVVSVVWIFNRARLVAEKRFEQILFRSFLIAALRGAGIAAIALAEARGDQPFSLNSLILLLLIAPFLPELLLRSVGMLRDLFHLQKERQLYFNRREVLPLILFSLSNYCVSALYVFASRYLFLHAEELHQTQLLVDLGYAGSFVGVVTILNTTLRSYYIGSLSGDDSGALKEYVQRVKAKGKGFFLFNIAAAIGAGVLVGALGSSTVSTASIWYAVIVVFSSGAVLYFGMITLLAKTLQQQWSEIGNNILRALLVVVVVRLLLPVSPLFTVVATNGLLIVGEAVLAVRMRRLVMER